MTNPNDTDEVQTLLERIEQAKSGALLHSLAIDVQHAGGILDSEREQLNEAIAQAFSKLNAASVGEQKARW